MARHRRWLRQSHNQMGSALFLVISHDRRYLSTQHLYRWVGTFRTVKYHYKSSGQASIAFLSKPKTMVSMMARNGDRVAGKSVVLSILSTN